MARPDTAPHILDTAGRLFWTAGYHGVNMNALGRAAGVNKATIYQHFASKEALAISAVAHLAAGIEQRIFRPSFEESPFPGERISLIYRKFFSEQDRMFRQTGQCPGCPLVSIGSEMAVRSPGLRQAVADAFGLLRTYYERIVDGLDTPGLRRTEKSRNEAVDMLMANMNACQVAARLENRPDPLIVGEKRALRILGV